MTRTLPSGEPTGFASRGRSRYRPDPTLCSGRGWFSAAHRPSGSCGSVSGPAGVGSDRGHVVEVAHPDFFAGPARPYELANLLREPVGVVSEVPKIRAGFARLALSRRLDGDLPLHVVLPARNCPVA